MTIESEEWRKIEGFPFYEVSSHGRVRSLDRIVNNPNGGVRKVAGRVLKLHKLPTGYTFAQLNDKRTHLVHRLVGRAFPEICGKWFEGCEIDHKNTVRDDNRAENLKVCSRHENHLNPITRQRYRAANRVKRLGVEPWNKGRKFPQFSGSHHWRTRPVYQAKSGKIIAVYESVVQAAEQSGVSRTAIVNNISGRSLKAGGFSWGYHKEELLCQ